MYCCLLPSFVNIKDVATAFIRWVIWCGVVWFFLLCGVTWGGVMWGGLIVDDMEWCSVVWGDLVVWGDVVWCMCGDWVWNGSRLLQIASSEHNNFYCMLSWCPRGLCPRLWLCHINLVREKHNLFMQFCIALPIH